MFKNNFGFSVLCGLISILLAIESFAESEEKRERLINEKIDETIKIIWPEIALGEEKLQYAIEVREKSQEELRNETIDYETYEKRCNEAINQALSVFDKAIAANPENPNFHYQRGLAMVIFCFCQCYNSIPLNFKVARLLDCFPTINAGEQTQKEI